MNKKLEKNIKKYCGETINIESVIDECLIAAKKFGWKIKILPASGGCDILVFERLKKDNKKRVYISAGIHGDEPAGPMTVLNLLQKK